MATTSRDGVVLIPDEVTILVRGKESITLIDGKKVTGVAEKPTVTPDLGTALVTLTVRAERVIVREASAKEWEAARHDLARVPVPVPPGTDPGRPETRAG